MFFVIFLCGENCNVYLNFFPFLSPSNFTISYTFDSFKNVSVVILRKSYCEFDEFDQAN